MLIFPTAYFKDETGKNPCAWKVQKMVTSAISLSHHSSSEDSKNSINFFSHSQLQHKYCMWPYQWLLLRHIAYPFTGIFAILMLIRMNPELGMD